MITLLQEAYTSLARATFDFFKDFTIPMMSDANAFEPVEPPRDLHDQQAERNKMPLAALVTTLTPIVVVIVVGKA